MRAILTLARKDLALMLRDGFAMFWILAFPLVYALFFGSIFGGGGGDGRGAIGVVIVDDDRSEASAALIQRLYDHDALSVGVEPLPADAPEDAPRTVALLELDRARDLVRKGDRTAYFRIPAGYGDEPWAVFAAASGESDLPTIEIGVDPSRQAEQGMLQGVLMEAVFSGFSERFTDKDAMLADLGKAREEIAAEDDLTTTQKLVLQTFLGAVQTFMADVDPDVLAFGMGGGGDGGGMGDAVQVVDVQRDRSGTPASSWEITFPQSMVWGLMSVAMTFAIMIVRERVAGTMLRLRVAPIGRSQLLAGKALGCWVACMGVMTVVLLLGRFALGMRFSSPGLLLLAMACTAVAFTGIMLSVSVIGRTENAVAGASWGIMMPFAMIGGGMIPLIAMPDWMRSASHVSPMKWAITSLEGAIWRDFSFTEMVLPCGVLVGIGALFFTIGVACFGRVDG